jgi:hypothetical protein
LNQKTFFFSDNNDDYDVTFKLFFQTKINFKTKTFCFCFSDNNDDNDDTVDDDGLLRLGQQPNGRLREKEESHFR